MKKLMPVLLMFALALSTVPRVVFAQRLVKPTAVKIKTDIARRLRDEKTNVSIRLRNGSELAGRITQAAENMFTLKENKTGANRHISYEDVMRLKGRGLSKGAKFGILTGILAGAVIIGALISLKNLDPFKDGVLR